MVVDIDRIPGLLPPVVEPVRDTAMMKRMMRKQKSSKTAREKKPLMEKLRRSKSSRYYLGQKDLYTIHRKQPRLSKQRQSK
jgi:hypothetical protein